MTKQRFYHTYKQQQQTEQRTQFLSISLPLSLSLSSAAAAATAAAPATGVPLEEVLLVRGRAQAAFLRAARLVGGRFVADAAVHDDPVRVVRGLLAGRLVQDGLRQLPERLLDVDVRLGRRLHEADVVLAGDTLSTFFADDAFVQHVALVAQNHLFHVLVGMLVYIP